MNSKKVVSFDHFVQHIVTMQSSLVSISAVTLGGTIDGHFFLGGGGEGKVGGIHPLAPHQYWKTTVAEIQK